MNSIPLGGTIRGILAAVREPLEPIAIPLTLLIFFLWLFARQERKIRGDRLMRKIEKQLGVEQEEAEESPAILPGLNDEPADNR